MGATNETDFINGISEVRNWLCSKTGYVRLEDDFNPEEYRLVTCSNGIEVSNLNVRTGEFDITFNCMPQRFLKSGEVKTTISSGGSITNPTLFKARPMLEVKGNGDITLNGYAISLSNIVLGRVQLTERGGAFPQYTTEQFLSSLVNSGDAITVLQGSEVSFTLNNYSNVTMNGCTYAGGGTFAHPRINWSDQSASIVLDIDALAFTVGTSETKTDTLTFLYDYSQGGLEQLENFTITVSVQFNASTRRFTISMTHSTLPGAVINSRPYCTINTATAYSSVSALGNPTYIDCDIGEVYKIQGAQLISLNNVANLGNELPQLKPGANTITFDNTITELKVVPRWWKV